MIDDETTGRLLRAAGPRAVVPDERTARVRSNVAAEWRAATRRTRVRRVVGATALLATAAALVLAFRLFTSKDVSAPPPPVAVVEQVVGEVALYAATADRTASLLTTGATVAHGDWVVTNATGRTSLRLASGQSVRFDTGSRARLVAGLAVELVRGAIYVDSGGETGGFEVRTPHGTAIDIGTQFEVRLQTSAVRVRVRSGLVELRSNGRVERAMPGTELTLTDRGAVRAAVVSYGPEWDWAAGLAVPFDIEGRSVAALLDHLSREQGWMLRYADADLARAASGMMLSGSIAGLDAADALNVLATSGLTHSLRDGELVVSRLR